MEVLAALLLVAIVLPVLMQGLTVSMRAGQRARHQGEATRLAESKLNELLMLRDSTALAGAGDFGEDWAEYRWFSEAESSSYGLYELTVTVTWTERGAEQATSLSTLVLPESGSVLQ
jgi:type II secretory pathway pseudopilin PulG